MRHLRLLCLSILAGACTQPVMPAPPDGGPRFDPFEALADPSVSARALPGRMHLVSSREPSAFDERVNDDWNHFVRVEGDRMVLFEEDGPGVVVRIWLTIQDSTHTHEAGDALPLHLVVDGVDIATTPASLTSGARPGFPRPWVAGRDTASNAFMVAIPIAFSRSMRIVLEPDGHDDLNVYYQIDWRELPEGTSVRSFDGALSESETEALARATALFVDSALPAPEVRTAELTLAPGEEGALEVEGPTVVRELARTGPSPGATTWLETDDVVQAEAPLDLLLFATAPSGPHRSALSALDGTTATLRYPIPVARTLRWHVRNDGDAPLSIGLRAAHDPAGFDPSLGRLRMACGTEPFATGRGTLFEVAGTRGQYAGQFLVLRGEEAGWWFMEGDHQMRVDGDWSILGTGIEDYIGGAFYYIGGTFALPTSGATGFDYCCGHLASGAVDVAMYRHHLLDTVPFEDSFAFSYEVYTDQTVFERCAFWYAFE